jgi:hypothetical protein
MRQNHYFLGITTRQNRGAGDEHRPGTPAGRKKACTISVDNSVSKAKKCQSGRGESPNLGGLPTFSALAADRPSRCG